MTFGQIWRTCHIDLRLVSGDSSGGRWLLSDSDGTWLFKPFVDRRRHNKFYSPTSIASNFFPLILRFFDDVSTASQFIFWIPTSNFSTTRHVYSSRRHDVKTTVAILCLPYRQFVCLLSASEPYQLVSGVSTQRPSIARLTK